MCTFAVFDLRFDGIYAVTLRNALITGIDRDHPVSSSSNRYYYAWIFRVSEIVPIDRAIRSIQGFVRSAFSTSGTRVSYPVTFSSPEIVSDGRTRSASILCTVHPDVLYHAFEPKRPVDDRLLSASTLFLSRRRRRRRLRRKRIACMCFLILPMSRALCPSFSPTVSCPLPPPS